MVAQRQHRIDPSIVGGVLIALVGLSMVLGAAFDRSANATQPNPEHKVTLCHATDSYTNPYTVDDVDVASVQFQGHDGHNGSIFSPEIPKNDKWGDIIPSFDYGDGMQYAGKNWPDGQAILDAGCTIPSATTTTTNNSTTTTTQSTTTTSEPTTTTTSEPTTTTTTTESSTTTTESSTTTTGSSTTVAPTSTTTTPKEPTTTTTTIATEGSTTVSPTTPTTAPNATTTTMAPTTDTAAGHATPPSSGTAPPTMTHGLPFTGSGALTLALVGLALIGAGSGLALIRRRQLSR